MHIWTFFKQPRHFNTISVLQFNTIWERSPRRYSYYKKNIVV